MPENVDLKNYEYGRFLRSASCFVNLLKVAKLLTTHIIGKENKKITNEESSVFTILIMIKTEDFRSSKEVCSGLLNWSFWLQPKISLVFLKNLCCIASRR